MPTLPNVWWVQVLLASAVDSWAPLRTSVLAALRALPKPLPGLEQASAVSELACWALSLLRSPRPFEASAAAQLLSLLHDVYVMGLGWQIRVHPTAAVSHAASDATAADEMSVEEARLAGAVAPVGVRASVGFLASVVEAVEAAVAAAEADMVAACRESFLQGPLLLLQALLSAFPWAAAMPLGHAVRPRLARRAVLCHG